jgi:hypothetical protein
MIFLSESFFFFLIGYWQEIVNFQNISAYLGRVC